jgi:superfamily II DNA or RNA helicase
MRGNSLLAQWLDGLYEDYKAHDKGRIIFKHFGGEAGGWDLEGFLNNPKGNLLMITNDKLSDALTKIDEQEASKTLIIYDEAHNLGSETRRNKTSKLHEKFKYRLGLTATPDRLFDEEGTKFLKDEIGPVIFKFTLEQAIERGILVEFDYDVLKYNLSVDENKKIHSIIKAMNSQHTTMTKEEGWIKMANVRKEAEDKIVLFSKYLEENSKVLDKCIIFVNTKEYGGRVVDVISKHITNYNTFYEQDNDENLQKLRDGTIQCLVTCHKVSEGIDIKALNTVILFSSSVDPRETIQRIGRTLRIDDKLPDKRAFILDFCDEDQKKDTEADVKRFKWLSKLSNTKRKKNG